jgi:hypothetical protein
MTPASQQRSRAIALVCTLKKSPATSSSDLMGDLVLEQLRRFGVDGEKVRCVDLRLLPGTDADMGPGDEWPALLEKIKAADIVVVPHRPGWATCRASRSACWSGWTPSCPTRTRRGGDFKDLDELPQVVATTTESAARNAAHLATALRRNVYPPYK